MKKLLSLATGLFAVLVAATLVSVGQSSEVPDLWNITNGVVVTDHSHFARWQTDSTAFDARDVFGGSFSTFFGETGDVVFDDYVPSGFVYFVEWQTPSPVTIGSIRVYAKGDLPAQKSREFATFTLKSKSVDSTTFDKVLFQSSPGNPYKYLDAKSFLVISNAIPSVTAQYFRAEFTSAPGQVFGGPRILELEATSPNRQSTPIAAMAEPILSHGFLVGANVTYPGAGYTNVPSVYVYGTGADAQLTASITNGYVASINVENAGHGYDSNTVVIIDPPAPESPRIAAANAIVTAGSVSGAQITDFGSGYTTPPVILFLGGGGKGASGTAAVLRGRVVGITITSPGSGYTSTPRIAFTLPGSSSILSLEVSAVKVSIGVTIGNRYQLVSTSDFSTWNPVGDPFVATSTYYEQNVVVSESARYFALVLVP